MLFLLQFYFSQKVKMHNRLFREKRKGREAIPQAQVRQKARCNGGHQKTFRPKTARRMSQSHRAVERTRGLGKFHSSLIYIAAPQRQEWQRMVLPFLIFRSLVGGKVRK